MKTDLTVAGYIFCDNKLLLIKHKKLGLWLPVGGHIEKDETPDESLIREAKEEVGLDIHLLKSFTIHHSAQELEQLAIPFYTNLHNVGNHNHYCSFYLCESLHPHYNINKDEVLAASWFSRENLDLRGPILEGELHILAFKRYGEMKHAMD
jgi:8-oxo-dGTP pyrophosphatase MutT (NUDIX family)